MIRIKKRNQSNIMEVVEKIGNRESEKFSVTGRCRKCDTLGEEKEILVTSTDNTNHITVRKLICPQCDRHDTNQKIDRN